MAVPFQVKCWYLQGREAGGDEKSETADYFVLENGRCNP
jgi:hypothetical protein